LLPPLYVLIFLLATSNTQEAFLEKRLIRIKKEKGSSYIAKNHSVHRSTVIILKSKIGINGENAVIPLHA
jgi:hypothetical protein